MLTLDDTTTPTTTPSGSVCPECGTIQKSGKASCCARGGSWFGHCGSAGGAKVVHTWVEGIRACEVQQVRVVVGQQLHTSKYKRNASTDYASFLFIGMKSKRDVPPDNPMIAQSMGNTSADTMTSSHASASASIARREYESLLCIVAGHVSMTNFFFSRF